MAEDLIVVTERNLPADELPIALQEPLAKAAHAGLVANAGIALVPPDITVFVVDAQDEKVEAIGGVPEKPCRSTHPSPESPVSRPSFTMPPIPVARVVGGLKPEQPVRQPTFVVDEKG